MLASRVDAALTAAGHHVVLAGSVAEAPLDGVELIVADLEVDDPEALVGLGVPVLGYYSHVDVETKRARRGGGARHGRAALADGARTAGRWSSGCSANG